MKIGIVLGSVRDGRNGEQVANWVKETAEAKGGAEFEFIDLKSFDLPRLTTSVMPMAAGKQYEDAEVNRWSQAIDACDGFIFVTPEYNHSIPGSFKEAVDSLGPEWGAKSTGLVGYGYSGGVRSIEHWRQILANFHQHVVRSAVEVNMVSNMEDGQLVPNDHLNGVLNSLIEEVQASIKRYQA